MNDSLQARAGSNAKPKPFWFQTASYGSHKSFTLDQTKGAQLLIPGPPYPGSGSKNETPRAQDTAGQADLGSERYMGARSRLVLTPLSNGVGMAYGVSGDVSGDIVLVRQDGKALVIGSLSVSAAEAAPGVYDAATGALGSSWCLSPGEDIVFIPNTGSGGSVAGEALWIPSFVDSDLICQRSLLSMTKQVVLKTPPGKTWYVSPNLLLDSEGTPVITNALGLLNMTENPHEYSGFINPGTGDIKMIDGGSAAGASFTSLALGGDGQESFFLPAGHTLSLQLADDVDDVYFAAIIAEYNQADIGDEQFSTPTVIPAVV